MAVHKKPQRFIPRINQEYSPFPSPHKEPLNMTQQPPMPKPLNKIQNTPKSSQLHGTSPLLIIFLALFVAPYIKAKKTPNIKLKDTSYHQDNSQSTDSFLGILSAIHPYLQSEEQWLINAIFGFSEITEIITGLMGNTYQTQKLTMASKQFMSKKEKNIGIMQAIQPYVPYESQALLDKVVQIQNTVNKLANSFNHYKSQDSESQDYSKEKMLSRIADTMDIIKPLMPKEQQDGIKQINKVLKIIQAIEMSEILDGFKKTNIGDTPALKSQKDIHINDKEILALPESENQDKSDGEIDSSTSTDDEQSNSLEMMIKMAQLLSQTMKKDA